MDRRTRQPIVMGLALFGSMLSALAGSAVHTTAQDCGTACRLCDARGWGWEGIRTRPHGEMQTQCSEQGCLWCDPWESRAVSPPAAEVLTAILASTPAMVPAVASRHSHRLLLDEKRALVAVLGAGCTARRVVAVAFVTKDVVHALNRLRVGRLNDVSEEPVQ